MSDDAEFQFPRLFESPAFLLGQLGSHSAYRFAELLAPLGIKPPQFGTLRILEANDGRSQQQLCEALGIHRNVMVGLVDDLEKRGLVERRRHPTDRRAHAVHLLPAARELLTEATELAKGLDAEILSPLNEDERATMVRLLLRTAIGIGLTPGIHPGLTAEPGPAMACEVDHSRE